MMINKPGHMTKMTTMPIYGKNPSKIYFARTSEPIATKLITKIYHDPVMTSTDFMARSTYSPGKKSTTYSSFLGGP